jgi:hypothetical protein
MKLRIDNEKGIALLTTLMLMVLGFGVVATLLYMVTYGTKTTSIEQKYATALDAAKGGADLIINLIQADSCAILFDNMAIPSGCDCLTKDKYSKTPENWGYCVGGNPTSSDPRDWPDLTLRLANCQVYVKIIDTRDSGASFLYTVNARADSPTGEPHAEISFVYSLIK